MNLLSLATSNIIDPEEPIAIEIHRRGTPERSYEVPSTRKYTVDSRRFRTQESLSFFSFETEKYWIGTFSISQ